MPPFKYHVLICAGPSCSERDANNVRNTFRKELERQGLTGTVKESKVVCLDLCSWGPTMVVYPDGVWYTKIRPRDVEEIVRSHIGNGQPVNRLIYDWEKSAT